MHQRTSRPHLLQNEFIGLPVKIIQSLNPTQIGTEGEVIDESMKTLTVKNGISRRMIPKTGTVFRFTLANGSTAEVRGDLMLRRPEDRVKTNPRRAS